VCYAEIVAARNITLSLPDDLIRKAKMHVAQRNSSVNALVRKLLEEALSDESRTRAAADELLAIAARGPYFDRDPRSVRRDEIYERR
jgi:plasmid stability protein